MKLLAKCPVCGVTLELTADDADKRIRCRRCRRLFKVPELDKLHRALDLLQNAAGDMYVDEQGNVYG